MKWFRLRVVFDEAKEKPDKTAGLCSSTRFHASHGVQCVFLSGRYPNKPPCLQHREGSLHGVLHSRYNRCVWDRKKKEKKEKDSNSLWNFSRILLSQRAGPWKKFTWSPHDPALCTYYLKQGREAMEAKKLLTVKQLEACLFQGRFKQPHPKPCWAYCASNLWEWHGGILHSDATGNLLRDGKS